MLLISDLDIADLVLNGFFHGVVMSISIGFLSYGINYAYKLFDL